MNRFLHKTKGAISVFLLLVLLPVLLFGGLTTDAARIYFSKITISDAGEMAMNAALANYDAELMDEFGLMVMAEEPESYGPQVREYFNKSLNGTGLGDEESYSHLLDLVAEEINTIAVQGSQIYRTEVEKQQIIEYMKYRAPLCLVDLVVEKLDALKETKKRTEAVEAQMEFSKSAKHSQDAIEAAYEAAAALNTQNESFASLYPGNGLPRDGAQQVLDYAQASCTGSAGIAGAVLKCYALSMYTEYQKEGELEAAARSFIAEADKLDVNSPIEEFNQYLDVMYYANTVEQQGGIDKLVENWLTANPEPASGEEADAQESDSGKAAGETQAHKQWREKKEELEELAADYKEAKKDVDKYPASLKKAAAELIKQEINEIGALEAYARAAREAADTAIEALENLEKKIEDTQKKWQTWSEKENEAYSKEEKSSQEYKDLFSEEENQLFQELLDKVRHLQKFYSSMESAVKKVKFCGEDMWYYAQNVNSHYAAAYSRAGEILKNVTINSDFTANLHQYAKEYETNFVSVTLSETVEPWKSIAGDPFYKKLQEMNEGAVDKAKADAAKTEANKQLADGGNAAKEAEAENQYPDFDWSTVENADTYLPSHMLALGEGETGDSRMTGAAGGTVDKDESENILQKYMDSIHAASGFLEGLDRILADTLEDLYVAEYAMQMCSYYTVDRDLQGNQIKAEDVITISGYQLAERRPYKAEVEYILWGNDSSQKNVKYTMMTLYGIRLLFNSLFAFTDTELRTSAQGIAAAAFSWAPFLVPIAQVLIQLGYAAIESGNDLKLLKQGYGVSVFKSDDTWATTLYAAKNSNPKNYTNKGVSLSYGEYLRIFMVLKMMVSGDSKTLARIGDCVQLASKFDLTKGYTMVAIDAKVKSRTTFMRKISEMEGGAGTWSYSDGYYPIQYQSIMGY